jgi:hypothetical protein
MWKVRGRERKTEGKEQGEKTPHQNRKMFMLVQ